MKWLILIFICLQLCPSYKGDGRFIDNGITSRPPRFVIEFPALLSTASDRSQFTITRFPHCGLRKYNIAKLGTDSNSDNIRSISEFPWVLGFRVTGINNVRSYPTVKVSLRTMKRGITIFERMNSLDEYHWITTNGEDWFTYLNGAIEHTSTRTKDGLVLYQNIVREADKYSWGSYFSTIENASYNLIIEIIEPATQEYTLTPIISGGGIEMP